MTSKGTAVGFALLLFGLILSIYSLNEPGGEPGIFGAVIGGVGVVAVLVSAFSSK